MHGTETNADKRRNAVRLVSVPVQTVRLLSRDEAGTHIQSYVDAERVTFSDGEVRQVFCRVNGSYPAPQVRVLTDDLDITEYFSQATDIVTVGPAATKGLQVTILVEY